MGKKKATELPDHLSGELDLREMLNLNRNKYLMINLLAQRARELNEGARPLVDMEGVHTHLETSITEAAMEMLRVVKKEKEKVLVDLIGNN